MNTHPNPNPLIREFTTRIADPGAFVPRVHWCHSCGEDASKGGHPSPHVVTSETVAEWGARAILTHSMFQPIEASDGSAPARGETYLASLQAHSQPNNGVSDFRALLDSAKGVTADQLELTLARGHLKEAARAFEAVRAENNQFRAYLRVAGSLLGRADADPIKLAQKVEAGIIAVNEDLRITKEEVESWRQTHVADVAKLEKERDWLDASRKESKEARERRDDLEREVAKARRVIVGNAKVEDSGSLLDMLNAVLSQASLDRANLAHADEKIRELQQFIASNAPQVSGSSGAL